MAWNDEGTVFEFRMEEGGSERIDKLLSLRLSDFSRSYLQKLVREGAVLVNQSPSSRISARRRSLWISSMRTTKCWW